MDHSKRVLIVEDDADIANVLALHLRDEHYEVVHSADGSEGLRLLEQGNWDALILDLMLPGVDGLEICRRARAMTRYTPIIITSARSSEVHRILGLELGADDYLAKPFSVLELVARVKALLRRVDAMAKDLRLEAGALTLAGLSIDPITREAQVNGKSIELTPREFDLLYYFASHPGKVFSRMDLLNAVWGYQHEGYEHTVNTHINRLRTKIEADPAQPTRILTVWGRGYKFDAQPSGPAGHAGGSASSTGQSSTSSGAGSTPSRKTASRDQTEGDAS
jgi:two-component system OmpR family response regulator